MSDTVIRPRPLPPVPPRELRRPGGDGRATRPGAVPTGRLTKRGRTVRDLLAGTTAAAFVFLADDLSHLFWSGVAVVGALVQ